MELQESEREIFVAEISEKLAQLNDTLLKFERSPDDPAIVDLLFRVAHTIKGNASFVDLVAMVELGHALEDGFAAIRENLSRWTADIASVFFRAADALTAMLDRYRANEQINIADYEILIGQIRSQISATPDLSSNMPTVQQKTAEKQVIKVSPGEFIYQIEIKLVPECAMPGMRAYLIRKKLSGVAAILKEKPEAGAYESKGFSGLFGFLARTSLTAPEIRKALLNSETEHLVIKRLQPQKAQGSSEPLRPQGDNAKARMPLELTAEATAKEKRAEADTGEMMRVSSRKIDDLINLVGELLSNNAIYTQLNQDFRRSIGNHPLFAQYRDNAEEMARIITDLQEKVLKVRMVPVSTIFARFTRVVRDYNARHPDKLVMLHEIGGDTEIDKGQIEKLYDPLLHMVRNSIDHGIENKNERSAQGKAPEGIVKLTASQEGNNIFIEIRDDGAGLNDDKIRQKAVALGLINRDEAATISKTELYSFIFMPGFSTAAKVTDISGRGVGMDVVKRSIEELHGQIAVESEQGKGTVFRIVLPLSLAIVTALRIRVRRSSLAIPITSIVETIRIKSSEIRKVENLDVVDLRGKHIPVFALAAELGMKAGDSNADEAEHIVIVQARQGRVGLRIDELFGYEDMVIKSLSKNFEAVDGVSGAAILGRGNICLILDTQKLVDVFYSRGHFDTAGTKPRIRIENASPQDTGTKTLEQILETAHENTLASLRQMTGISSIGLEYRRIMIESWDEISAKISDVADQGAHFFYTKFESGLQGAQFIRIKPAQMNSLAALFYGNSAASITEHERISAIKELTNIVSVSLTNALTVHAGLRVYPTVPMHAESPAEILQHIREGSGEGSADAVTMDVEFLSDNKQLLFNYTAILPKSLVSGLSPVPADY